MTLDVAAARARDRAAHRRAAGAVRRGGRGRHVPGRSTRTWPQGVREITIRRGYDPREFPMVVAGGAGPIHACMICQELEIPLFIVPRESSIFCAAGMLMSDLKHDFVRSLRRAARPARPRRSWPPWSTRWPRGGRAMLRRGEHPRGAHAAFEVEARAALRAAVPRGVVRRCRWRCSTRATSPASPRLPRRAQPALRLLAGGGGHAARADQRARCARSASPTSRASRRGRLGRRRRRRRAQGRARGLRPRGARRSAEVPVYDGHRLALRQPHRRPGHGRAGEHHALRQRGVRLRGRRARLVRRRIAARTASRRGCHATVAHACGGAPWHAT